MTMKAVLAVDQLRDAQVGKFQDRCRVRLNS